MLNGPTLFLVAGGLAVVLPYAFIPVIPGVDFPNDLARLAVLGAAPDAPIRLAFQPHWALMPDLGLETVYMALRLVASPDLVLRACMVGSMAALLALVFATQRLLFGPVSHAAALAPLCVAGQPMVLGFANFEMSCPLILLGAWLWLAWREDLRWWRLLTLVAVSAAAWLCHFAGYALLMVFLACGQAWMTFRRPTMATMAGKAAALFAIALPGVVMSALAEHETVSVRTVKFGLLQLRGLFAPVMTTGTASDLLLWLGLIVLIVLILVRGKWFIAPAARASLLVIAIMVAALPWQLGAATEVGVRLATPAMMLLLAASRITFPFGVAGARIGFAVLALLIVQRDHALIAQARSEGLSVVSFRQAVARMPVGASLMAATDKWRDATCRLASAPLWGITAKTNMAAYATIDRGAWEPFLFAAQGKQPIRSAKAFARGELPAMPPPALADLPGVVAAGPSDKDQVPPGFPAQYDYLLIIGRDCRQNPIPALLSPIGDGPGFSLFKIAHAAPL